VSRREQIRMSDDEVRAFLDRLAARRCLATRDAEVGRA
jgi:hypothetical protein